MPTTRGSLRIFRVAGIDVYLHWLWFLVAGLEMTNPAGRFQSPVWNVLEYLALFFIVLLHEFCHALACRSVGGVAKKIVLWPLGGVAYVMPPRRPGATLWTMAAGPLLNVAIAPVLLVLALSSPHGWGPAMTDLDRFLWYLFGINLGLLAFNLLPIYPLDGGQMLRALLWFFVGPARSLQAAAILGFAGVAAVAAIAIYLHNVWLGILGIFIFLGCLRGLKMAKILRRVEEAPRREALRCPACRRSPPAGEFWRCSSCRIAFDTFETGASCPKCHISFAATTCVDCGAMRPMSEWSVASLDLPSAAP